MRVLIFGARGQMGRVLLELWKEKRPGDDVIPVIRKTSLPIDDEEVALEHAGRGDVLIDFSKPEALEEILEYCLKNKTPLVLASTGHDEEAEEKIRKASSLIPIFYSANLSLGVYVLKTLVKVAAELLGEAADIEIIEKHHNKKHDAPSGTALMLLDAVKKEENEEKLIFGRHGKSKRQPGEIGIHAIRGGTIVGEHTVLFAMADESLELTHRGESKRLFATGAMKAGEYMMTKEPGLYGMDDLINGRNER
ncbi:MAG: 4-hydroxy-tetrahydrodipicolinate reductase [Clostridiaceae bacterium]